MVGLHGAASPHAPRPHQLGLARTLTLTAPLTLTLTLTQTPTLAPALTLTLTRYRALSLRLHPDRGGDPAAFARVATAHECLLDEAGCRRGFHEGADLAEIGRAAKGGLVDELERSYFPARYPYQPFGK